MSTTKNTVIAGLALCSGVLSVIVWRQSNDLRRLLDELQSSHPAHGAMTVRPAAHRSIAVAQRTANAAEIFEAEAMPRPAAVSFGADGKGPSPRRGTSALVRLMENPEFVQALTLQRQAMLDARFGELFRRLNLEGDQLAVFKRLLAEKENAALDVVTVSETGPQGPLSPEAMRASIRAAHTQIEQAIHSSLGSDRYAVYREYEQTLAHRATVAQLEQRLSYTSAPLTPTQADAVVRILASNTPAPAETPVPPVSVLVRGSVPEAVPIPPASAGSGRVTEEIVAQAQTVLVPAQVDALREIQLEQQAAIKAAQMIREVTPAAAEIIPLWPTLLMH